MLPPCIKQLGRQASDGIGTSYHRLRPNDQRRLYTIQMLAASKPLFIIFTHVCLGVSNFSNNFLDPKRAIRFLVWCECPGG